MNLNSADIAEIARRIKMPLVLVTAEVTKFGAVRGSVGEILRREIDKYRREKDGH